MNRTDDGQLVGVLSQQRHMFANVNAWRDGRNRRKLATNVGRGIGFRVPRFVMTHPAPAVKDDASFRSLGRRARAGS